MHRETGRSTEFRPLGEPCRERTDGHLLVGQSCSRRRDQQGLGNTLQLGGHAAQLHVSRGARRREANPGAGDIEVNLSDSCQADPGRADAQRLGYVQQSRQLRFALKIDAVVVRIECGAGSCG